MAAIRQCKIDSWEYGLGSRPRPKHGSWLNITEIELSVMSRHCLNHRIATLNSLKQELSSWEVSRNQTQKGVDWQFTTDSARIKLKRLYPQFKS